MIVSERLPNGGQAHSRIKIGVARYSSYMNELKKYVEELVLYATPEQIETISKTLQKQFVRLAPHLFVQGVTGQPLEEDEMGLKDYWQQQFGESNNPYAHVLLRVDFLFTSDGTTKLDVLSMQVYSIVSEVMKQFEGVEHFSSFSEETVPDDKR